MTIYYLTDGQARAGGQFVNEEHVLTLREAGYDAYMLYVAAQGIINNYQTATPTIIWSPHMEFNARDIIVIPEPWQEMLVGFANVRARKIVHCQNPFYLFFGFDSVQQIEHLGYNNFLTCGPFVTRELRSYGYLGQIFEVPPAIPDYFFSANHNKSLQILLMPRKRPTEARFIRGLFQSRHVKYRAIPWVTADSMGRVDVAHLMNNSAIFISLGNLEGLGLPPLEAMAAGCLVVGFRAGGGTDYATSGNGLWVNDGDLHALCDKIAEAIDIWGKEHLRAEILKNSIRTAQNYSNAKFKQNLLSVFERICNELQ